MPPIIAFDADVLGRGRTGDETYAAELLGALAVLDPPFRVAAYVRRADALPEAARANNVVVPVEVPVTSNYLRGGVAIPARLHADRPALFHGTYLLPPGLPCPGVVTIHDGSSLRRGDLMPRADRLAFRRFVPWSARRAARVVTVSEHARRDLLELLGPAVDPDSLVAIPNGVSTERFRPVDGAEVIVRERLGVEGPYVLFLGALQPRKNLPRLLEAWARVVADPVRDEVLVLAGAAKQDVDLSGHLERLGIVDRVRTTGYVATDLLPALYSASRLLAFPSLYEGFALPVLEAMACGAPVVASDTTAIPGTAGGAAVLVDPLAPGSIAEGIARVLRSPEEAARLRSLGLARAAEMTWSAAAERHAALWLEVIDEHGPRRWRPREVVDRPAPARIVAVVTSTGQAADLPAALDSLLGQGLGESLRIVVVCNRPGDGSAELVRERYPAVVAHEQPGVRGVAENQNTGLAQWPGEFGLVSNPDIVVEPGALRAMLDVMEEHPRCGVVAPLLVNLDGTPQASARRFPEPAGTILRRTPLRSLLPPERYAAGHYLEAPPAARPIDWAMSAFLLVRRSAWDEVGGQDEGFERVYVEEIDLQWRMWQAGWEVWQTPAARVRHEHQAVSDAVFWHPRTYYHAKNMLRFVRKHPLVLAGMAPGAARSGQASSRETAAVSAAACSQVNAAARRRPSAESSTRLPSASTIPSAIANGSRGSTRTAASPHTSGRAPAVAATTGAPAIIASSATIPKPSWRLGTATTVASR